MPQAMNCASVAMITARCLRPWMLFGTYWVCLVALAADPETPAPTTARRTELVALVRQDCGSCHGLTLKGGLGPALLPDNLKGKGADSLKWTILQGRPGTPMPPWQRFLSEAEADWIVDQLQKGFPSAH